MTSERFDEEVDVDKIDTSKPDNIPEGEDVGEDAADPAAPEGEDDDTEEAES